VTSDFLRLLHAEMPSMNFGVPDNVNNLRKIPGLSFF